MAPARCSGLARVLRPAHAPWERHEPAYVPEPGWAGVRASDGVRVGSCEQTRVYKARPGPSLGTEASRVPHPRASGGKA